MPAFTFEKILPPPTTRGPIAPAVVKKRGVIVQMLDHFVEARVKRASKGKKGGVIFRAKRAKKKT